MKIINPTQRIYVSHPKSEWRFINGIGIRTRLKKLEFINQSLFCFLGFRWTFSGTITDWNQGVLEDTFSEYKRVILKLEPELNEAAISEDFIGDTEINSSHPRIQQLNPKIYAIRIDF